MIDGVENVCGADTGQFGGVNGLDQVVVTEDEAVELEEKDNGAWRGQGEHCDECLYLLHLEHKTGFELGVNLLMQ